MNRYRPPRKDRHKNTDQNKNLMTFGKCAQSVASAFWVDTQAFTTIMIHCILARFNEQPLHNYDAANRVSTSSTNRKRECLAWEKITALALMFASIGTTATALAAP